MQVPSYSCSSSLLFRRPNSVRGILSTSVDLRLICRSIDLLISTVAFLTRWRAGSSSLCVRGASDSNLFCSLSMTGTP